MAAADDEAAAMDTGADLGDVAEAEAPIAPTVPATVATDDLQQQLLQMLLSDVGMDEQLGSTVKTYYRGVQRIDALVEQLASIVVRKEQEIERLCNHHYQDFVQSVDQLLRVRSDAAELTEKIQDFHRESTESTQRALDKKKELVAYRQIIQNIDLAMDTNKTCMYVLELANKINMQIEGKKYYSALKTLEELKNVYLPHVIQFDFAKHLRILPRKQCYPSMQKSIKNAVLSQLKDWMVKVREESRIVGFLAMEQTTRRVDLDDSDFSIGYPGGQGGLRNAVMKKGKSLQSLSSIEMVINEEKEIDLTNNDRVKIDFRPLYQCLHIHDVLGLRNVFRTHYDENRRLQANLVLSSPFSLSEKDVGGFETYLHDIIGFFIVEFQIVNTTEGFRSRSSVDTLWETATGKLHEVISNSLKNCRDPDHFLQIKHLMICFIQTMEGYQYAVSKLMEVVMTFFERYSELTMEQTSIRCRETIETDEGNAMTVQNMTEHSAVMDAFAYTDKGADPVPAGGKERIRLPRTFPFSSSFIDCCVEIRQFIEGFYQFVDGFPQQHTQMDEILRKAVEKLIAKQICTFLDAKLTRSNIQLSEIVRVIFNIEYFEQAVVQFEQLISQHRPNHRASSPQNVDLYKAAGAAMGSIGGPSAGGEEAPMVAPQKLRAACLPFFRDCRKRAENRIFEVVNHKIDDFLECASYDFLSPDPSKPSSPTKGGPVAAVGSKWTPNKPGQASPYLEDLVAFLTTVWTSTLAELPMTIKSFVYYDAIYHISSALVAQLLDINVRKVSPYFVELVLEPDIQYLETFVRGLGDANLLDQLAEIKQALLLLRIDTPLEEYLNPTQRSRKFSRLPKRTVVVLLEKYLESGAFESGGFFGLGAGSRDTHIVIGDRKVDKAAKRKSMETVLRALAEDSAKGKP